MTRRPSLPEFPGVDKGHRITVSVMTRRGRRKLHTFISAETNLAEVFSRGWLFRDPWHWAGHRGPLRDMSVVRLAPGVDIDARVLVFILDALRYHGRHKLDLDDLRRVVSQLGSRIANVHLLPADPSQGGICRILPDGRMQREQPTSGLEFESVGEPAPIRQHAVDALYRQIAAHCTSI